MQISVLVINYNTGHLIKECIDSILRQVDAKKEIIVVDNASHDNSLEVLKHYENEITIVANKENVGFGRANNQAAKIARGEYIFLLNPDAVFQDAYALKRMLEFMQLHPQIGLCGTQVAKTQKGGYSAPQYRYPGQKHTGIDFSHLPGDIAWVIGASMMIRRQVFAQVNGFDEDFFLYGEEADLCLRIRKAGHAIGYNPMVMVNHVGGGSEQKTDVAALWKKKQNGLHLFIRKNYPSVEAVKVVAHHLQRAKRKLLFLKLSKLLGLLAEKKQQNYVRYQVVVETSRKFLKQI